MATSDLAAVVVGVGFAIPPNRGVFEAVVVVVSEEPLLKADPNENEKGAALVDVVVFTGAFAAPNENPVDTLVVAIFEPKEMGWFGVEEAVVETLASDLAPKEANVSGSLFSLSP